MQKFTCCLVCTLLLAPMLSAQSALARPDVTFKVFQFPPDKIPRIDGNADDWAIVPDSYAIGTDQLMDTERGKGMNHDPRNLDVKVKVGWVKGLNRLYFLYEAYDNYWDFSRSDLHNDIFEVVVDGDLSGGPLIDIYHRDVWTPEAVGQERSVIDPRGHPAGCALVLAWRARAELSHFHTAGRQGLGHGLGLRAIHQAVPLRQRRVSLQLQAGRER